MSAKHPKYDDVLTLAKAGNKPEEIAFMVGLEPRKVSEMMYRMRKYKKLPAYADRYYAAKNRSGQPIKKKMRGMTYLLNRLPQQIQTWLRDQIPAGATLEEVVAAIITDAYHESTDHG